MAFALGIDIGTSKIAAVIYDAQKNTVISSSSISTTADLPVSDGRHEQDTQKILDTLDAVISELSLEDKKEVRSIGVTGQQHGVVLWNRETKELSNLYTWRDGRCLEKDFLKEIKKIDSSLSPGFGVATLSWIVSHEAESLNRFDASGTIQDLCVDRMCGLTESIMDPTNAASWGCFDVSSNIWMMKECDALRVPKKFLPKIVPSKTVAGKLLKRYASRWKLPEDIPVTVSIGDNQASLLSTLTHPSDEIALTLGTGGQISVVVSSDQINTPKIKHEIRPFFNGQYLAVGAALLGGGAFRWFLESVSQILKELEISPPERETLYAKLNALALKGDSRELSFAPHFSGERFDPFLRGSIQGINTSNFSLSNIGASLSLGIIENLKSMLPQQFFDGRKRVVGSGNGLRKLSVMREKVEEVFNLPLVLSEEREEAAVGAAIISSI